MNTINEAPFDINSHLHELTDDELKTAFKIATDDLVAAAGGDDREWHEACFAGTVLYAQEMNKRGLTLATKH